MFNEVFEAIPIVQRLGYDFDSDFLSMLTEDGPNMPRKFGCRLIKSEIGKDSSLRMGKLQCHRSLRKHTGKGIEAGWMATSSKPEHGGMGAPIFFQSVIWGEIATSTNMAMSVLPALTLGVYDVLNEHGDQDLIDYFSNHLSSGEWAGTMCLTEPHAGTDLGIISSKAIPR